jgi:hypothetical protein
VSSDDRDRNRVRHAAGTSLRRLHQLIVKKDNCDYFRLGAMGAVNPELDVHSAFR